MTTRSSRSVPERPAGMLLCVASGTLAATIAIAVMLWLNLANAGQDGPRAAPVLLEGRYAPEALVWTVRGGVPDSP